MKILDETSLDELFNNIYHPEASRKEITKQLRFESVQIASNGRKLMCPNCKQTKSASNFVLCRSKGLEDGFHKFCDECEDKFFDDGKLYCVRCKEVKPFNEFHARRDFRADGRGSKSFHCKSCERQANVENDSNEKVKLYHANKKILAIKKMGGVCQRCGYNEFIEGLALHHVDPTNKEVKQLSNVGVKRFLEEADKCVLLCMNCHMAYHGESWTATFVKRDGLGWTIQKEQK